MAFGGNLGVFNTKSGKQKLNAKSSTETEVIEASDYLPWAIWTARFMKYQFYIVTTNIFYQDNNSAIKLEENGINSAGDKSRHIDIRYFFIKDVLIRENMTIEHCPTEFMVADFFTKPLQGKHFANFRDYIMGLSSSLVEERVGDQRCVNARQRSDQTDVEEATKEGCDVGGKSEKNKTRPTYADVVKEGIKQGMLE